MNPSPSRAPPFPSHNVRSKSASGAKGRGKAGILGRLNEARTAAPPTELIEVLAADAQSLLARESRFCCFCGHDLFEPR
jgi:hypothetical protein